MNNRMKELRKTLGLTQEKFALALGIKQNTIAQYETGRNKPIDAVVSLICREFNVNEKWLRNGDGEMFLTQPQSQLQPQETDITKFAGEMLLNISKEAEIARFAGEILRNEDDTFKKRLVKALAKMDENQWLFLENLAKEITEKD